MFFVYMCAFVCSNFRAVHFADSVLKMQIQRRKQIYCIAREKQGQERRRESIASH